ncbi:MAG: DUF3566 domain-containing protein [Propionibacteriaceae bacterium]|jgi:hypothetical protein|nr:DUF3566 domain-containing protein [Propionibacteriaceae bacterium]
MSEGERINSGSPSDVSTEPGVSVGARIVQSFKNRTQRLQESAPVESASDQPTVPTPDYLPAASGTGGQMSDKTVSVPLSAASIQSSRKAATRQRTGSRRARLRVARVDPWSVMKISLLFAVAGWIILIVATWVVFVVLDRTGLYDAINSSVTTIFSSSQSSQPFKIQQYVNTTRATAVAALIGAVNVVIMTALATIFAFLYNLAATVMGGIEVTLSED